MARTLGEAGRYVSQEAGKKERQMLMIGLFGSGAVFWISGFLLGFWHSRPVLHWACIVVNPAAILISLGVMKWCGRKVEKLAKERSNYQKAAEGEISVSQKLQNFPDGFYVINGLKGEFGDIDHLVVGPTGVYALDAKSWKGVVSAADNGELMWNGQTTSKPEVKRFVSRVMAMKDRVKALAPGIDPYVQTVFVFTAARVQAKRGATGALHCIRDEQLYEYIVEDNRRKLGKREVNTLARAFAALARMDPDFVDKVVAAENLSRPLVSA